MEETGAQSLAAGESMLRAAAFAGKIGVGLDDRGRKWWPAKAKQRGCGELRAILTGRG